jgi:hypothetical protein
MTGIIDFARGRRTYAKRRRTSFNTFTDNLGKGGFLKEIWGTMFQDKNYRFWVKKRVRLFISREM